MTDQQWYYESNGEQAGPISWDGLMFGMKTGMVTPETRVRSSTHSEWIPLAECIQRNNKNALPQPRVKPPTHVENAGNNPKRSVGNYIALATLLSLFAAVVFKSCGSNESLPPTNRPNESARGGQAPGELQGEALDRRIGAAIQMLNDGKLSAEQFKQLRVKFKSGLDKNNGKQLTGYAFFLWAADDAKHLPVDIRIDLHEEGDAILKRAESLGYTQAYVIDGSWTGGVRAGGMVATMGPDDPRTKYWPILSAVQQWSTGAAKGDPACRFMLDRIAPNWEVAQGMLAEHLRLVTAYATKPSHAPGDPDITKQDELKKQWILTSGMMPIHAKDHPQHAMPCWEWLNDKGGELFAEWKQAHPQQ